VVDYRQSGVDIDAGNEVVRRIRQMAKSTYTPGVLSGIGSFGGLFALDGGVTDPVLVASADGVGTKLKVAFMTGTHDSIGVDLVNHCVNDILVQGARPLFCALLGGETAEMPGFYADGEYDVAGFIVGVVPKAKVIDGSSIVAGDVLIGLPSSGLHTNGYSLARQIVFEHLGLTVNTVVPDLGESIGTALLRTHRSYLKLVAPLLDKGWIKGMAHITGGGLTENLPRTMPEGRSPNVDRSSWDVPPLFAWLQRAGGIADEEMFRAFNMGVGMVLVCAASDANALLGSLHDAGEPAWRLGDVT
jgi:phosphoribosylformylglycinamidine cyclo-ligase